MLSATVPGAIDPSQQPSVAATPAPPNPATVAPSSAAPVATPTPPAGLAATNAANAVTVGASASKGANTQNTSNTSQDSGASSPKSKASVGAFLLQVLNSNFASAFIGLLGGIVGFFVSRRIETGTKKREEDERYFCVLQSVANELDFYADKFKFLSGQLQDSLAGEGIIPSYQFYPSFLEQGKIRLSGFMRNPSILKEVGHCHFELSHIRERLSIFINQFDDLASPAPMMKTNTQGFLKLVESNIPVFQANAALLRDEAKAAMVKWSKGT